MIDLVTHNIFMMILGIPVTLFWIWLWFKAYDICMHIYKLWNAHHE